MSAEIFVRYPFVHCTAEVFDPDEEGGRMNVIDSWRPGVFAEGEDPWGETIKAMCDGEGFMILTELGRCQLIRPFHARVLFLREWQSPDGRRFGKRIVRMCSVAKFESMRRGYRAVWSVRDRPREEWAGRKWGMEELTA